jgi:hypothetical protein
MEKVSSAKGKSIKSGLRTESGWTWGYGLIASGITTMLFFSLRMVRYESSPFLPGVVSCML